jgi:hypothetical protein
VGYGRSGSQRCVEGYSFYFNLEAPNSVKDSGNSMKRDVYMHSPTHVDLTYGNVVSILIKDVTATTDCVQAKVFFEVINGLLCHSCAPCPLKQKQMK